jgi:hypothetical protein
MPIGELLPGEAIQFKFDCMFAGEDDWIAVGAFRGCRGRKVRSSCFDNV